MPARKNKIQPQEEQSLAPAAVSDPEVMAVIGETPAAPPLPETEPLEQLEPENGAERVEAKDTPAWAEEPVPSAQPALADASLPSDAPEKEAAADRAAPEESAVPAAPLHRPQTTPHTAVQPVVISGVRRSELVAWVAGGGLLTLLVALLFSLGVLSLVNGGLHYQTESQARLAAAALQERLVDLDSRVEDAAADIGGLRTRLDALETLSARVSTLETGQADLAAGLADANNSLGALEADVTGIQAEVDVLTEDVAEIREATSLFQRFLEQLRNLLNELTPAESISGSQP